MIAITLDIDWAPDFAIDFTAEKLVSAGVKATWFVTHASPAVDRLREHPNLFELGIHPNFYPGSTHGDTPEAVLNHCMELVPDAISMRTHGIVQSSKLLDLVMEQTPIRVDTSIFLPRASHVKPFVFHGGTGGLLIRVPYVWEDDYEMRCPDPIWDPENMAMTPDIQVLNFHPIHIYLNGTDSVPYREFLKRCGASITMATENHADGLVQPSNGPGTMFKETLTMAKERDRLLGEWDGFSEPDDVSLDKRAGNLPVSENK